jgi:uncharacterized membrane protein YphA (DoxX/SURF4 family)
MKDMQNNSHLTDFQQWGLIVLRIIIGWHLIYEGIVKLINPGWTAENYLTNSRTFMSETFHAIASNPTAMELVNFLNIWGLILIGAGLLLGFCARTAVFAGIFLLFFYYISYPPFHGFNFGAPQEGSYLLIDKTFIEMVTLSVLALFPGTLNLGLWSLLKKLKIKEQLRFFQKSTKPQPTPVEITVSKSRRDILKHLAFLPFLGSFAWAFASNRKYTSIDAFSGSTFSLNQESLGKIEGEMPMGVLVKGKPPISRLILGSNILSGTAHSRDLIYSRSLFRAYNTEKKIIETYILSEQAGINLFFLTPLLTRYRNTFSTNIQTWANVVPTKDDIYSQVDKLIDQGVDYILIQGAACDRRVLEGNVDVLDKCVDHIKRQGYPAGLGAHSIEAFYACEEAGIEPDFYYKTMHNDNYWSAHPIENRVPLEWRNMSENHNEFHDNMWCLFPEKTIKYIRKVEKPVVGFKVLAAGAIPPEKGFQWAFDNGADFIEVGMFDFQIVANVNQTIRSVKNAQNRIRPWYG